MRSLALESEMMIDFTAVDPALLLKAMIESPHNNHRLKDILYAITKKI